MRLPSSNLSRSRPHELAILSSSSAYRTIAVPRGHRNHGAFLFQLRRDHGVVDHERGHRRWGESYGIANSWSREGGQVESAVVLI